MGLIWCQGHWPEPGDDLAAALADAVAVYLLPLQGPLACHPAELYLPTLSANEHARWRQIAPAERRWQYLQSRVLQRRVLAAYVARAPSELSFVRNQWGRPRLADSDRIHFSLSHCASHVALAVGKDPLLGVDVESPLPPRRNFLNIARQQFNQAELLQLDACPDGQRHARFLEMWTLKEAYLKAFGLGMHKRMADPTVERDAGGAWRCHDRTLAPSAQLPLTFLSQLARENCQLALAYRDYSRVTLLYLNPSAHSDSSA